MYGASGPNITHAVNPVSKYRKHARSDFQSPARSESATDLKLMARLLCNGHARAALDQSALWAAPRKCRPRRGSSAQRAARQRRSPSAPRPIHGAARQRSSPSAQQARRDDQALRHLGEKAVLVHRGLTQEGVGLLLGELAALHQDSLRPLHDLALLERLARALDLLVQPIERLKPAHRERKDGPYTLLAQAVDDVGADAGLDRRCDHVGIGAVDEQSKRPARRARDLEHLLELVGLRAAELGADHIGLGVDDPAQQAARLAGNDDVGAAGVAQPLHEKGRPLGVSTQQQDLEAGFARARAHVKAGLQWPCRAAGGLGLRRRHSSGRKRTKPVQPSPGAPQCGSRQTAGCEMPELLSGAGGRNASFPAARRANPRANPAMARALQRAKQAYESIPPRGLAAKCGSMPIRRKAAPPISGPGHCASGARSAALFLFGYGYAQHRRRRQWHGGPALPRGAGRGYEAALASGRRARAAPLVRDRLRGGAQAGLRSGAALEFLQRQVSRGSVARAARLLRAARHHAPFERARDGNRSRG